MSTYNELQNNLQASPAKWLVTGAGGFIGSHLVETLLKLDQTVTGMDNLSSGSQANINAVKACLSPAQWSRFTFIKGDIRNKDECASAVEGADYVLHQAALCSVALSIEDPLMANAINVDGFLNILTAAQNTGVKRVVYASSSAVYGDTPGSPKQEMQALQPISPYAVTKYTNELYANTFTNIYKVPTTGLRYFNIFGIRQDPAGAYAAVIPKWVQAMIEGTDVNIHGDGETTRDFCHIDNVVQANILAACSKNDGHNVYNVGTGQSTTLNQLYSYIREGLLNQLSYIPEKPLYTDFRIGDIRHSLADIDKAKEGIGYIPNANLSSQLQETVKWYLSFFKDTCK